MIVDAPYRTNNAIRVDPDMIAKTIIFDREQCVGYFIGHILDLNGNPFFERKLGKHGLAVIGVDGRYLRRPICRERRNFERVARVIQIIRSQYARKTARTKCQQHSAEKPNDS